MIATFSSDNNVYIFDYPKHQSNEPEASPDLTLQFHQEEGFCLAWNPWNAGYLLSGALDGKICLWNIENA